MAGTILLVDDEAKLRSLLKRIITLEGFEVLEADTLKQAGKILERTAADIILCDVKLPDGSGVDFTVELKEKHPSAEVILLTAYGNIPDGVQAIKNGAFDYLVKGDDNNRIIPLLNRAMEKADLKKRIEKLEKQVGKKYSFDSILGQAPSIQSAIDQAKRVAASDATVLLLGETGTGKEVFAQAIHHQSKRNTKPFVALNCSAFSKELLESELFGYRAGAFTNALRDKKGLFEEADTGTLFLDEIGEMPTDLQSKLLRVLEAGEFLKIGDTKPSKVNVRIIAATNRDLKEEVGKGQFREDLFYRLHVFSIHLPPLRERKKDIPALTKHFVALFAAKLNRKTPSVSEAFLEKMQQHPWRGNIRELRNVVERAVLMAGTDSLTEAELPEDIRFNAPAGGTLSAFDLASVEKLHILRVLQYTGNNKTEAARLLNIGTATLYRKIEEYKI